MDETRSFVVSARRHTKSANSVVELERPSRLTVNRHCSKPITWWCAGDLRREENSFVWPDGTKLSVRKGSIAEVNPEGLVEKLVHFGGMKWADPHPFTYPTIKVEPADGQIVLEVVTPDSSGNQR